MLLKDWRNQNGLTLVEAASCLGLKSAGALSEIERGLAFPALTSIAQIDAATGGRVMISDHYTAWASAHAKEIDAAFSAGERASRRFGSLAERTTNAKTKAQGRRL